MQKPVLCLPPSPREHTKNFGIKCAFLLYTLKWPGYQKIINQLKMLWEGNMLHLHLMLSSLSHHHIVPFAFRSRSMVKVRDQDQMSDAMKLCAIFNIAEVWLGPCNRGSDIPIYRFQKINIPQNRVWYTIYKFWKHNILAKPIVAVHRG